LLEKNRNRNILYLDKRVAQLSQKDRVYRVG